ncbi:MAG: orotidine-5'-phosphate decarboxylase [Bacteroidales bacterium]|nr:orotidine-5'-phosphate decarboxylase [Bacteroidales bacterium]
MDYNQLYNRIKAKQSFLCVGLDPDISLIPVHLKEFEFPLFEFNKEIIDATAQYAVAFKLNLAFYECEGLKGWQQFEMTANYIRKNYPAQFLIADAKRGDIGNTAKKYAAAFFEQNEFDAVTIAPYMGRDSVAPFLEYKGKWAIVLALTSNQSSSDFETLEVTGENNPLYKEVIKKTMEWGTKENIMFVCGATKAEKLTEIRSICPDNFLLVPGVGAQGGSVEEVSAYGMNSRCGLLINASRSIIFAYKDKKTGDNTGINFSKDAAEAADFLASEMKCALIKRGVILQ